MKATYHTPFTQRKHWRRDLMYNLALLCFMVPSFYWLMKQFETARTPLHIFTKPLAPFLKGGGDGGLDIGGVVGGAMGMGGINL